MVQSASVRPKINTKKHNRPAAGQHGLRAGGGRRASRLRPQPVSAGTPASPSEALTVWWLRWGVASPCIRRVSRGMCGVDETDPAESTVSRVAATVS